MHQLGMHDMAEGVLARTRRQAGNRSSTLLTLMQQYQSQGNAEVAVQIAHQVLRRTTPSQNPRYRDENSIAREQALQVLVRSGQLDKLIERAEQQIERSPGSVHLHEILADYYKAAGKTEKAGEVLARISKIKPENAQSLFQLAVLSENRLDRRCGLGHLASFISRTPLRENGARPARRAQSGRRSGSYLERLP